MVVKMMMLKLEDESETDCKVWAEEGGRSLLNIPPTEVKRKLAISPIQVKQYPVLVERKQGLAPVIKELIKDEILESCMSSHNTPILKVKKSAGTWQVVQDLREINKQIISRYPLVSNPCF